MLKRIQQARTDEEGFTLVELLVVIVILGILAAVVVFAVGGIKDKGQKSSCEIDRRTLATAEEAYFGQKPPAGDKYASQATKADIDADATKPNELVAAGFLSAPPQYHSVAADNGVNPKTYAIVDVTPCPG